jgi:UrcA family protein
MKKSFVWAAAVLMGSFLGMAHATAPASDGRQKEVYYGDLDLNSRTGTATLYRRIEAAARLVCQLPNERTLAVRVKVQSCVNETTARAFTEANAPALALSGGTQPLQVASRALYIWTMNR